MDVTANFIDTIAKPFIVAAPDGTILKLNDHARLMLRKLLRRDRITSIFELDPEYASRFDYEHVEEMMDFQYLRIHIDIFRVEYDKYGQSLIYIFDDILFNVEVDGILNSISYVINIVNPEGAIEFFNNAGYTITGLTTNDTAPGHSLIHHYESKSTITTEPTFYRALREKRPVTGRGKYITGVTLLNKATPIFKEDGGIKRVLIIGQDVSESSAIDEMLMVSEDRSKILPNSLPSEVIKCLEKENYLVVSDEMKKTVGIALKASTSDASVFIWGESGVGKEMIAKIIHKSSKRKDGPFISINCAAIPHELMESELFGYEQGAFTGANKIGKKGLLEEANGGTVFLDELGEMPYVMQSKLLRAIQEHKIRKVGGSKDIPIDVRYVSATNLKAEKFMDNSILREDLYYRLGAVLIHVPPLRNRRADIPPLIMHYLKFYNDQQGRFVTLSKKALRTMVSYDWPGNIRELKNVIERIVLMAEHDLIDDIDIENGLDINLLSSPFDGSATDRNEITVSVGSMKKDNNGYFNVMLKDSATMDEAQDEILNILFKRAYRECGSIVKAAEKLQINPSTIHRKIKQGKLQLPKIDKNDG